jgi:hypothetical protein
LSDARQGASQAEEQQDGKNRNEGGRLMAHHRLWMGGHKFLSFEEEGGSSIGNYITWL